MSNWKEWFEYKNGNLFWKKKPSRRVAVGQKAGNTSNGYYEVIKFNGRFFKTHRIIYEMFNNTIPEGYTIDHIDGNIFNNTIENLRLALRSQNLQNRIKPKNNTSSYKGVTWSSQKKKWRVRIGIDSTLKHIGHFDNLLEAAKAYNEAALKYHGEFAKVNPIT
jgi:hypothetical protein